MRNKACNLNIGEKTKLYHFHYEGLKTSHCFQWEYK